jgi:hypothetical protein
LLAAQTDKRETPRGTVGEQLPLQSRAIGSMPCICL